MKQKEDNKTIDMFSMDYLPVIVWADGTWVMKYAYNPMMYAYRNDDVGIMMAPVEFTETEIDRAALDFVNRR